MEVLVPESNTEESAYLVDLLVRYMPDRLGNAIRGPSITEATKLFMLLSLPRVSDSDICTRSHSGGSHNDLNNGRYRG